MSRVYRALDAIFLRSDKLYEERVPRIIHSKDKTAGHAAEHPRFKADHFQKHFDENLLNTKLQNIS